VIIQFNGIGSPLGLISREVVAMRSGGPLLFPVSEMFLPSDLISQVSSKMLLAEF
jgi:hypothetical protein